MATLLMVMDAIAPDTLSTNSVTPARVAVPQLQAYALKPVEMVSIVIFQTLEMMETHCLVMAAVLIARLKQTILVPQLLDKLALVHLSVEMVKSKELKNETMAILMTTMDDTTTALSSLGTNVLLVVSLIRVFDKKYVEMEST